MTFPRANRNIGLQDDAEFQTPRAQELLDDLTLLVSPFYEQALGIVAERSNHDEPAVPTTRLQRILSVLKR